MIKLLLDADLPKALSTALRRRNPGLDVRRSQERSDYARASRRAQRFVVGGAGIGTLVNELELIVGASEATEWDGMVQFVPFISS